MKSKQEVAAAAAAIDCRNNAHTVMSILNTIQKKILVHKFRIRLKRQVLSIVLPTGDNRNQEQDQGSLGDLPQIQTRVDIKKLHAQTSSTTFRRHSFSDFGTENCNFTE